MCFQRFIITAYKKVCVVPDLRIPKHVSGRGSRFPFPTHTLKPPSPPFFLLIFFFCARLEEDKWCRARAPRTGVGPTFGEEHRGCQTPRNTEKVHIIYHTPSMRPAHQMVKWPHHRAHHLHQMDDIKRLKRQIKIKVKKRKNFRPACANCGFRVYGVGMMPFTQSRGHRGHLRNLLKKNVARLILGGRTWSPILFLFYSQFSADGGLRLSDGDRQLTRISF